MAVECTRCKANNLDGQRFCGQCGVPLDPALLVMKDLMNSSLREEVRDIIRDHYKDQKIVEVETTAAIAEKLSKWAKLFAFFVGIPIALFLLLFGVLGIKTYGDLSKQVETAQREIATQLLAAQNKAEKLKSDGDSLAADYEKLRVQFGDTKALAEQLTALRDKVDVIGERLGFTATSTISSDQKTRLLMAFEKFKQYLRGVGYMSTNEQIGIDTPQKMKVNMLSYYDRDKRLLVIDRRYANDPLLMYHEFMRYVLNPSGGPSGAESRLWSYIAIESGLALYFPSSFLNNPKPSPDTDIGWDLSAPRSFSELRPNFVSAQTDGAEVWGGAFWEIRQKLGQDKSDKLLFDGWGSLRVDDVATDRGAAFVRKLLDLDKANQALIRDIFTRRGMTV